LRGCDGLRAEEALFTIPDKDGIPITLTWKRWEAHILIGHPAMAKHLEAIGLTISDPDYILQSDKRADTRLFYRLGVTEGKYSNLYVVVVIRYTASAGFVRTAYLALKPIAGGEVVWIRPKH